MLTLEQTLEQQKNLNQLCADRPQKTSEFFAGNAFYGIDLIIKKYANLSPNYPLKAIVPHGVNLSDDKVWEAELQSLLPTIWAYPPYRVKSYLKQLPNDYPRKQVIPAVSPFLYLIELLKNQPKPKRQGTIFFPFHSTHHIIVKMDDESLAEKLEQLPDTLKPITVCIYWKDYHLGRHIPFEKRGIRVVSAGHIYDPDFLFRFYHLCSLHQYASSNGLGSHLFYAVKAGCAYFQLNQAPDYELQGDDKFLRHFAPPSEMREEQLQKLFTTVAPETTPEQIAIVDEYLGAKFWLSPEQMRSQIFAAETEYNYFLVQSAVKYLNQGNNAEALKVLEMAIAALPNEPGLHYGKAIALARMGQTQAAIESLNILLAAIPEHPKARQLLMEIQPSSAQGISAANLVEQATEAINTQNHTQAFDLLNQAKKLQTTTQKYTQNIDYLRGICFLNQHQPGAALQALQEELRYFPQNTAAQTLKNQLLAQYPQLITRKINDPEFQQLLEIVRPYTMLSEARLYSLFSLVKQICQKNIPGNIVECGVAGGGSTALMAAVIQRYSKQPRWLYAFDSFSGMPAPTEKDRHQGIPADQTGWGTGTCAAPETTVQEICSKLKVRQIVKTVKGYFQETLPKMRNMVGMISLLHVDGDWYESTQVIFQNLYDRVVNDGYIQVDDYGHWEGCRQAVHEFAEQKQITLNLQPIDETGVFFIKPDKFPLNPMIPSDLIREFSQDDPVAYGIESQMSLNERFQLYYVLRQLLPQSSSPLRFVEIGSYAGSSLFLECQTFKRIVPQFQGFAIDPGGHPQLQTVLQHFKNEVTHLQMLSHQAAPQLQSLFAQDGQQPVFIFVDGDHSYEGVRQDILNYFPLLAPGGIMVFHDYLPPLNDENRTAILFHHGGKEPGIRQACQELMDKTYHCERVEVPLLYPTDPTQTQAHLPIIPGVFSTLRVYRKLLS